MARTATRSLKAKIKLIASHCLYLTRAVRQGPATLSDAEQTALITDFVAPSQLACPIPQFSVGGSFTTSYPRNSLSCWKSWTFARQNKNPLCKPGNYHRRNAASEDGQRDDSSGPCERVSARRSLCRKQNQEAWGSPGRFRSEPWRCSSYRCPGLRGPSATGRGAWAGSSSAGPRVPSAAPQRWPPCRTGPESHPVLLFW